MEHPVKFRFGQEAQLYTGFLQGDVLGKGFFRGFRRIFVADIGIQGGNQHQGVLQILPHFLPVGPNTHGAALIEGRHGFRQKPGRLQKIVDQNRHEHVQLEIALTGGNAHGGIVAHDLHGNHGQGLALGGVDLAGHDGGAWLVGGNGDFSQTQPGAGGQPAHIVGNFHQVAGKSLQRPMGEHQLVLGGQGVEFVGRCDEGLARQFGERVGGGLVKPSGGVQARTHGGTAQRQLMQRRQGTFY